jgi:zinc transporter 2
MCDACHMLSDVTGFMISYFAIYISQRKATRCFTFGFHRAEVIGALCSIFLIWSLLIWLNCEATHRILHPPEKINANAMLITAVIGLTCNLINLLVLETDQLFDNDSHP